MTTGLMERPSLAVAPSVTNEQLDLIRRTVAKDATPDELKLYLYDCQRQGVHPLDKLIHFTKRSGKYTPVTSIDFMRTCAADTGEYAGSDDAVFDDGLAMKPDHIEKATVTVWRMVQGQRCAFTATARWNEYKPDGDAFMWRKMPHTMLGKCAEALALRKGFPRQLAGLYTADEMAQATNGDEPTALVVTPLQTPVQSLPASLPSKPNGGDSDSRPSGAEPLAGATLPADSIPPGYELIAQVAPSRAGAVGELVMSNGASYLFYKQQLKPLAEECCQLRIPVQLDLKKSATGNQYAVSVHKLPQPITDAELDAELAKQAMARQPSGF